MFENISSTPLTIQEKWFINLSSKEIPFEVRRLLQFGEEFCLPVVSHSDKIITEFIKHIENNLHKIRNKQPEIAINIRNQSLPIIHSLSRNNSVPNSLDKDIMRDLRATKEFIKKNTDILFTRADKGNITVALDKSVYITRMEELLQDKSTYLIIKHNPINKILGDLHSLLIRWKRNEYITMAIYKQLNSTVPILPRAYGLPKIHKFNHPFRIIVSSIGNSLYSLAAFLHEIIQKNISFCHISNSFQLIEKLSSITLEEHYDLLSLDVVSLFTNVPTDLAIEGIKERWSSISLNT